ncbi:hypothetical protein MTO96_051676 [Rhipicephalus appendiculatus]
MRSRSCSTKLAWPESGHVNFRCYQAEEGAEGQDALQPDELWYPWLAPLRKGKSYGTAHSSQDAANSCRRRASVRPSPKRDTGDAGTIGGNYDDQSSMQSSKTLEDEYCEASTSAEFDHQSSFARDDRVAGDVHTASDDVDIVRRL